VDKICILILGGSIGTLLRFWMCQWVTQWLGPVFPFGTLVVNLLGCFLIGLIAGLPEGETSLSLPMRLLVMTGFLGALTTFSTYEYESFLLGREGQLWKMFINLGGSVFLGFLMLSAGYMLVRLATGIGKGA
jgi:fluoride exporter